MIHNIYYPVALMSLTDNLGCSIFYTHIYTYMLYTCMMYIPLSPHDFHTQSGLLSFEPLRLILLFGDDLQPVFKRHVAVGNKFVEAL